MHKYFIDVIIYKPYRSAQLLEKGITMGIITLAPSLPTNLAVVHQHLCAGNMASARHELLILSDRGANDAAFFLAKSVLAFFDGKQEEASRLLLKVKDSESWSPKLEQLYGQLLIEGAICKLLMRDTHADLVTIALRTAEGHLASAHQHEQAAVTTYIEILEYVATGKDAQAWLLHQKMVRSTWADSTDTVLQSWKRVFDMAILRSLCEHTRLADRLFAYLRGQVATNKREIYCVDVLDDILRLASMRARLHAVRIFIFGQVGVWS